MANRRTVVWALVAALLVAGRSAGRARAACPPGRAMGEAGDKLRVGFTPMAPFAIPAGSDGHVRGFAVELLRSLAGREGWTLELIELSPATLREQVAGCDVDLGVAGVPASAALASTVDLSQPYFSTATTALVRADDLGRAGPAAGERLSLRLAQGALRGLIWGLAALALLAVSSWLLNAVSRRRGRLGLRWGRADAQVSGPLAGLAWLWRSTTGRVLAALWIAAGLVLGATGRSGGPTSLLLGDEPLRALVERAARGEKILGERYPDGGEVDCSGDAARACFQRFADGTLAAMAGPREVLCTHLVDLAIDRAVLRDDLAVPEQYAFMLPSGSSLRVALDRALLRWHEEEARREPIAECPGVLR